MFDEGKNYGITIDLYIPLCYYSESSKYVILSFNLMIYKEFFRLRHLFYFR